MSEPCRIPLADGSVALVDAEDYERVHGYPWHVITIRGRYRYAVRSARKGIGGPVQKIYLHREVLGADESLQVRFRTPNTLDCRRSNLRVIDE